jgi:hypothetical protein
VQEHFDIEVISGLGKLHDEDIHNHNSSPNINW